MRRWVSEFWAYRVDRQYDCTILAKIMYSAAIRGLMCDLFFPASSDEDSDNRDASHLMSPHDCNVQTRRVEESVQCPKGAFRLSRLMMLKVRLQIVSEIFIAVFISTHQKVITAKP